MARKTKEEAQKTRETILRTAENLFFENGVTRTSLQEIAAAANVTRGAVYWHFKDKVDILWTIADDVFMPHEDLLDRLVAMESDNPLSLLYQNCIATLDSITNNPRRRRVFTILTQRCENIAEMELLNRRNNACRDRLLLRLQALFEQIEKKSRLAPSWTPQTAALALQTLVIGFIHVETEFPAPSRKRDKNRKEALTAFFKSLGSVE